MEILRDEPTRVGEATPRARASSVRDNERAAREIRVAWRTWIPLLLAPALLGCPRADPPARLSSHFVAVARLATPPGSEAAMARARQLFAPHAAAVEERVREHQRFETAPLAMGELETDVIHAFDAAIEARATGGRLPAEGCDGRSLDLRQLALALIATAPTGGARQLDAALWLGARIIEERPSLIGAAIGIDVMAKAVKRLDADGLAPREAMRALAPSDDFVTVTFAREVLCLHARIDASLAAGEAPDQLELALIERQRGALVALHNETLAELERAPPSPAARIGVLARAYERARASESELVQALASAASIYEDLEEERAKITAWLARPALEEPPPPHAPPLVAEPPEPEAPPPTAEPPRVRAEVRVFSRSRMADARALRLELEGSGLTLTWQDEPWGFLMRGVAAGSLAAELGFRDGDLLRAIGQRTASSAQREGQGGIGYLVDGLDGHKIAVELVRDHKPDVLLWELQ